MRTVAGIGEARAWRAGARGCVGLVPTMGFLHEGHLSLVAAAREECDAVAVSVFVNPTQFGPEEDYARYPRDPERDRRLLAAAGVDLLFEPGVSEMYPPAHETRVDPGAVAAPLEGERRPGHFQGVATVVLKLLGIVRPDRAYFGEKDAQQLAVIRRVAVDLDLGVEVRACPIVREPDGLALSSRNAYLGPAERVAATVLARALDAAEAAWNAGERRGPALEHVLAATLAAEPLARVDYAVAADPGTFRPVADRAPEAVRLLLAVFVGSTRLIDNRLLTRVPAMPSPRGARE